MTYQDKLAILGAIVATGGFLLMMLGIFIGLSGYR